MPVVNPLRHPQVLFIGFEPADPRLERMQRLVGTSLVLSEPAELSELRLADWDALVLEGVPLPYQASKIHILAFESPSLGQPAGLWATIMPTGRQPSRTLHITDEISTDLRRLVTTETIPWLEAQDAVPYLQSRALGGMGPSTPHNLGSDHTRDWIPVVSDADGNVVLGAFPTEPGDKWCWTIPHRSNTPELWLTAVMVTWRAANPESFPDVDPWRAREPWITNAERDVRAELEQLREDRRRAEEAFRQRELKLDAAVLEAGQQAEQRERRLLTAQADELVDAVKAAFTQLGLNVEDMDEARLGEGVARAEDLQVTCPDRPDVRIIAEVKGYARGGAKASDLIQLSQHALRYTQRERQAPDRSWYIVNQFATTDPDTRQPPLAGATEDVQVFAEGGGLIIDTRELFKLGQMVAGGEVSPERAREELLTQRAVFTCPGAMTT